MANRMFTLPGYIINEKIYENNRLWVYRGKAKQDQSPVIIKALKAEMANPVQISKMLYEYEIARCLDIHGVIRPVCLERNGVSVALIMEDIGAISLRKHLQTYRVDLISFFSIAVQLTEILGEIHRKGIVHRDLKPDNILIHPGSGIVKIIDFSTSVCCPADSENTPFSSTPAGTLEYMPPEQTGRMNRGMDYRSDFYSLGVVFYEMLTGQLPWQAKDPVEWLHSHLVRKPESPEVVNPGIPGTVADIIIKLLAKTVELRYQSVYGLLWDLEECRQQLSQTGKNEPFTPGRRDVSPRLQLPRKLYGREMETEALQAAFERICTGQTGIILVSGYAGVGKTVLINETLKPLVAEKGYFLTGKFDQLRYNKPFYPFVKAFGNLIRQLLTESQESLDLWRQRILRALGGSGMVIAEVIPEVELIVGAQPPVEALPPIEAQNRLFMVLRKFIRVFTGKEHPLVIFLDDLQWADQASLQLFRYLGEDTSSRYLLFIGAWRDHEITERNLISVALEELRGKDIKVQHIQLSSLDRFQAGQLVAGALHCPPEKSDSLADVLYRKSGGNPFFLGQLLKEVYDEKLLGFNMKDGCWEWELESIQRKPMSEDVVDLILGKLQKLPGETLCLLKLSACIGNTFDLQTLAVANESTWPETGAGLLPATTAGLVIPAANTGKALWAFHQSTETERNSILNSQYEFLHDRVQQTVYSLIPEEEKQEIHLKVGRLILQNTCEDELDEKILSIMDHFNRSLNLIADPSERLKLAEYNLMAGRKTKALTAYDASLNYFKNGMELLPDNLWNKCYRLSYDLHLERAQCEYLAANIEIAEKLFDVILDRAETELERAGIYGLKMVLYAGMGKYTEAIQIGINALGYFGIKLPVCPGKLDYARELVLYKLSMFNKKIEDLLDLPEMSDPVQRKVSELLIRLASVTSTRNPDLYGLTIIKAGNHAVKYGNTEMAAIGYIGYSITAGIVLGDYAAGYEFGKVCMKLVERYNKSFSKCIVYFVFGALISHWTQHGKSGLYYLHKAVRCGVESGDVLIIGYARAIIIENKYLLGRPLGEVAGEAREYSVFAKRMKHESLLINTTIYEHLISTLRGPAGDASAFGTESFVEDRFFNLLKKDQTYLITYYFAKIQLDYLFEDYENALAVADMASKHTESVMGFMFYAEYIFYYSLAAAAMYDGLLPEQQRKYRKILRKNQRQMKKWSDSCSDNFRHKYLLVAAEIARLSGRGQDASSLYDQTIQSAHEHGYVQNVALANELAAKYYLAEGREKVAQSYMRDACSGYQWWGAGAKVRALQQRYPNLLGGMAMEEEKDNPADTFIHIHPFSTDSDSEAASSVDMVTIRKAVQNFSEETDPDQLFISFLEIATESAGADKGYFILEKDGKLFIEAAKESDQHPVTKEQAFPLEKSANLPQTVVRYVARTLESVVLNGGEQAGIFVRDPYIALSSVKSIVCLPVLFQRIPVGVLYLENSMMTGVFTPDKLEVLKLLSAQIACVKKLQTSSTEGSVLSKDQVPFLFVDPLTERETEVLHLIAAGLSNKEIAEKLGLKMNTVKTHILNIYGKLRVNRRVQVVAKARELKLLN